MSYAEKDHEDNKDTPAPASAANDVQPGGNHYEAQIQHWDWSVRNRMDPLAYAASKYVTRWRKKPADGRVALEKVGHYIQKMQELHREGVLIGTGMECVSTTEFAKANSLTRLEEDICRSLLAWRSHDDLVHVAICVKRLLREAGPAPSVFLEGTGSAEGQLRSLIDYETLVKPAGWIGFVYEGTVASSNLYRCNACREPFWAGVKDDPNSAHSACTGQPPPPPVR